jgi:hypothetical protein
MRRSDSLDFSPGVISGIEAQHGLFRPHGYRRGCLPRTADSRSNPPMMRSDPPDFSPSVIPGIEVRHRLFRISGVSAMVFGGLSLRSESALRNDSVWFLMG